MKLLKLRTPESNVRIITSLWTRSNQESRPPYASGRLVVGKSGSSCYLEKWRAMRGKRIWPVTSGCCCQPPISISLPTPSISAPSTPVS